MNPFGKLMEKAGGLRDGGAFWDRMGQHRRVEPVMDEDRHLSAAGTSSSPRDDLGRKHHYLGCGNGDLASVLASVRPARFRGCR